MKINLSSPIETSPTPAARPATAADIDEIVRITNLAYACEAFCIRGDRTNATDIAAKFESGTFLVIEDAGDPARLLGSVYAMTNGPRGYLGMLTVAPAAQGRGLSRRLVAAVEDFCRRAGCSFLDLTVVNLRTELFAFYAGLGFAACDTVPFPQPDRTRMPLHLVRMTKALVAPELLPAPARAEGTPA